MKDTKDQLRDLAPYRESIELDFPQKLAKALKAYCDITSELDIDKQTKITITNITKKLRAITRCSLKGLHSTAYIKFQNLVQGNKKYSPLINLFQLAFTIKPQNNFYRIRQLNTIYGVEPTEIFHIPLTQRGIVRTQRYSSPGYPCLYLGKSIYGCWEEMRRPSMQTCAVSRLKNNEELPFIDLRVDTAIEKIFSKDKTNALKLFPLIIACMIPVANNTNTFKPEYTIPQLLIEWMLRYREKNQKIIGIAYTSTHINNEFDFTHDKFTNYAIPVINTNSGMFCDKLCSIFKITYPTTNDLEKLKCGYGLDSGKYDLNDKQKREDNYKSSDFGNLETRLKDTAKFPLYTIDPKQGSIKKAETPNDK